MTAIQLNSYLPILLFIAVGIMVGVMPVVLGSLLAPRKPYAEKLSPYECGFEAFEDARMKFDVRYYLIAILFILFDLEVAFLVPWAVILRDLIVIPHLKLFALMDMLVFLGILLVGYIYAWRTGALEWE